MTTLPCERAGRKHYAAVWRWHFYAGLYVAPFLMMLATSGLVMLAKQPLERWQLGAIARNASAAPPLPHQARLDAVRRHRPGPGQHRGQPPPRRDRQGMAAGVPLHMGSLGGWSFAAAILVCLATLALALSGLLAWWRRRPSGAGRLAAPPGPVRVPAGLWVLLALFAVLFPLGGAALLAVALLDRLLLRRFPALGRLLS